MIFVKRSSRSSLLGGLFTRSCPLSHKRVANKYPKGENLIMIGAFLVATVLSVYMTSLAATHTAALRTTLFLARRNPRPTTSV